MTEADQKKLNQASVVAFVHAKGESERLPGKNLRILGDRPLVCYAIRNALAARLVDAVVIDSDSDEILRVGADAGAIPIERPSYLAAKHITGHDLANYQAGLVPHAYLILQVVPTSPFILPATIDAVVNLINAKQLDSVMGCRRNALYEWVHCRPAYEQDGAIPNSQELPERVVETTGLYAVRQLFAATKQRRTNVENCLPIWLSPMEAIDIDYEEDFEFAEIVWRGMQNREIGGNRGLE